MTPDIDPTRKRPYKTGELAQMLEVSQRTVIRMIDDGEFGVEGKGWKWSKAGAGRGDRKVFARAVKIYLARND